MLRLRTQGALHLYLGRSFMWQESFFQYSVVMAIISNQCYLIAVGNATSEGQGQG